MMMRMQTTNKGQERGSKSFWKVGEETSTKAQKCTC